jgi:serine/threonine-protein kinase SRPK3
VVRSAQNYTEAARDEVMLLQQIRDNDPEDASHCVRLLDQFEHCGPHGRHVCEVFEPMGDDLLTLIRWVLVLSEWVLVLCWW